LALSAIRVLVCDDDLQSRALTRLWLQECAGVEVIGEAESSEGCLDRIAELGPDVALIDHALPGTLQASRFAALADSAPGTRVLLYSGLPSSVLELEAKTLHAHGYINKRASAAELEAAIHAAASRTAD
jgi:two-component system nitrate/nitrite response regulator NarL